MAAATPSPFFLWLLLVLSSVFLSISSAAEFSLVVSEITTLLLSPSLVVEKSPGLKPGTKVKCERVQIHGLPRLGHLNKFANSVKVKVSHANLSGSSPNIEMCFQRLYCSIIRHKNFSLGIAMCPQDKWERFTEGLWIKSMSPFDHKLLDTRMAGSYSESLQVSLAEEFFLYRVIFLVLGILMMALASWLSESLILYYSGAMAVGVFLASLMFFSRKLSRAEKINDKKSPNPYTSPANISSFSKPLNRTEWAVAHADRITLAPNKEEVEDKNRRWFGWF